VVKNHESTEDTTSYKLGDLESSSTHVPTAAASDCFRLAAGDRTAIVFIQAHQIRDDRQRFSGEKVRGTGT
jgi:hypothetical protein